MSQYPPPVVHGVTFPRKELINREDERALALTTLLDENVRLLTLAGPPGIGKTHLALAVAEDLISRFPEGVWFVDLSAAYDRTSVISTLVDALHADGDETRSISAHLQQRLHGHRILLLLDTVEHLHSATVLFGELLAAHPELHFIATSRQPLGLKWEHVLTLPPLAFVPDPADRTADELAALPAVRLFMQSAQARRIDFTVTPESLVDVAAICAELEGVPGAIELAAGWVNLLPPSSILEYSRRQLDFLRSSVRQTPHRQRSLVATLDWSYDLLGETEQRLFRRVGVFLESFTIDAAAAVTEVSELEALDVLGALVEKNLVQVSCDEDADMRFRLTRTVRSYARDRLEQSGEQEASQARHAQYFLLEAEKKGLDARHMGFFFAPATRPPTEWSVGRSAAWFERERASLVASLRRFRETGRSGEELRLAYAVAPYWWAAARLEEGAQWLQDAMARSPAPTPALRIRVSNRQALIARQRGQGVAASHLLEDILPLARTLADPQLLAEVLVNLATTRVAVDEANIPGTLPLLGEASLLFEAAGDPWGSAIVQVHFALIELIGGHGGRAQEALSTALAVLEQLDDLRTVAVATVLLGHALWLKGDTERALPTLAAGLRLGKEMGEPQLIAVVADLAAWLIRYDEPEQAAVLVGASDAIVALGFVRAGYNRFLHRQTVQRLQDWLPEAELESALGAGRAWTLEDTVMHLMAMFDGEESAAVDLAVSAGQDTDPRLTAREVEVLRLLAQGMSTTEIAQTIFVSAGTVKMDLRSIFRKLNVQTRAQAMAIAVERNLI